MLTLHAVMQTTDYVKHHAVMKLIHIPRYMQMATVLIYLAAPEEGGETVFPLEGEHGLDRLPTIDYTSCEKGLKVRNFAIAACVIIDTEGMW